MRAVLSEAIEVLRQCMGEEIHIEIRDFLQVHNKKGQPCPRCGHPISEIRVAKRATNFCRRCQPGTRAHLGGPLGTLRDSAHEADLEAKTMP